MRRTGTCRRAAFCRGQWGGYRRPRTGSAPASPRSGLRCDRSRRAPPSEHNTARVTPHTYARARTHTLSHTHTHTHTLSLSLTHTHTHTHSLSHTHTHSLSLSLSLTHTQAHTHTHSLSHTLLHTHTHSHTHTHTLSLSYTHTLSLSYTHTHTHTHTHTCLMKEMTRCVPYLSMSGRLISSQKSTSHFPSCTGARTTPLGVRRYSQ